MVGVSYGAAMVDDNLSGLWMFGTTAHFAVMLVATLQICMQTLRWTLINVAAVGASFVFWFASVALFSHRALLSSDLIGGASVTHILHPAPHPRHSMCVVN